MLADLFAVQVPAWELVLRGTIVYWFIFLVLRLILHRDLGALGLGDVLFLVLIADAAQVGMVGDARTVSEALIVVTTIVGWNWLLDWAAWRVPALERLANPPPIVLVRRGRVLRANLAREWISVEELQAKLREQGIERMREVKIARLESDGQISVIRYGASPAPRSRKERHKPA
jgi:uncharacterized membrane protein YcaP (DUF421 family)